MARPKNDSTPAYGGNAGNNRRGNRGLTFNMSDKYEPRSQRPSDRGNRNRVEVTKVGWYEAVLFDLGDKDRPQPSLVSGVPMQIDEVSGEYLTTFHFTIPPEASGKTKPETLDEILNLSQWFAKRNRKIEVDEASATLLRAELPLTTHDGEAGVLLFIRPPGSGGLRLFKEPNENPPMSMDDLRTETCYIEKKYNKEIDRERAKKALPKDECFLFPGADGEGLMHKGIRIAYPLFRDNNERRLKRPHEHIVLLQKGRLIKRGGVEMEIPTRVELMCQFRHDQKVPNWYDIQVNSKGEISVTNIRDPQERWMSGAMERLQMEEAEHNRKVEENLSGI